MKKNKKVQKFKKSIKVGKNKSKNRLIRKKGIIFCDLEGVLTHEISFWKNLNLELGMSESEDLELYEEFIKNKNYPNWVKKIFLLWNKYSPDKLNLEFFMNFFIKHLKIREGAKEFIKECRKNYSFIVISGSPWEFCELAKKKLGFDNYYSTNYLVFDKKGKLKKVIGDIHGFQKDYIMKQIVKFCGFNLDQVIAIGDSDNDITMLNEAGKGILVGENTTFRSQMEILRPKVNRLKKIDFDKLIEIINEFIIE
ncbi:MAG: HAD family hydrolase [Candidatus Helarchaeota archaeon]